MRTNLAQLPPIEQDGTGRSIVAPVGGLNARDALANMPETDAVILDNFFPQPSWVEVRGGKATIAKAAGYNFETVAAYNGLTASQLFGAGNNSGVRAIFRVDGLGGGNVGAPVVGGAGNTVQPVTNTQYDWWAYGTGSLQALILANGADPPLLYDGAVWWPYSTVTANITGITQAASAVVTVNTVSAANPFIGVPTVSFQNVAGMTQINGLTGAVTATGGVSGAWTVTVSINSSAFSAYSSGGIANPYILPGVSGAAGISSLNCVASYKQRLWFLQKGTFNVYYLAQNAIAGTLIQLNMAPLFQLGGALVSIISVSIDNSAGLSDYIAFVSNQGEIVVFQGYDPSSTATWDQAARFRIGRPIGPGRRCWQKMGSDAAIVTVDGVVMMSDALLTDRSQTKNELSDKVRKAVITAIRVYGAYFGWQLILYPIGNKLLLNVPTGTAPPTSYAFAMNTLTGAWSTFGLYASPWNALCYEVQGDNLYYGGVGVVCQADTGGDDDGVSITAKALTAFSYFGAPGLKKAWSLARPVIALNGSLKLSVALAVDFNTQAPLGSVGVSLGTTAPWNTSLWTTPTLWSDPLITYKNWVGAGGVGFSAALEIVVNTFDVQMQWSSTDFFYEPAEQAGP